MKINEDSGDSFAASAVELSFRVDVKAILVSTPPSSVSSTSKNVAKFRPKCPIVALVGDAKTARQLHLYRGIVPLTITGNLSLKCDQIWGNFASLANIFKY